MVVVERGVGLVQGGDGGLQCDIEHDKSGMVRVGDVGKRKNDLGGIHDGVVRSEVSAFGDRVPRRLARAAPGLILEGIDLTRAERRKRFRMMPSAA